MLFHLAFVLLLLCYLLRLFACQCALSRPENARSPQRALLYYQIPSPSVNSFFAVFSKRFLPLYIYVLRRFDATICGRGRTAFLRRINKGYIIICRKHMKWRARGVGGAGEVRARKTTLEH